MTEVLHKDSSTDGNLTAEEYYATYFEEGTTGGHEIPEDVLAEALKTAEKRTQ